MVKVGENFMGIASLLEETGGGNKCAISISPAGPYTPGLALIRHLLSRCLAMTTIVVISVMHIAFLHRTRINFLKRQVQHIQSP